MQKFRNRSLSADTLVSMLGVLVLTLCAPTGAIAQESPGLPGIALVKEAQELLQVRDYVGALTKAQSATEINPDIPAGWFLQGFALNRLGRHEDALAALKIARKAGLRGASFDYEIGWAAIFVGEWNLAAQHLESYDRANPGDAKVSSSIGLALFGRGELDKAEARLQEAIARDPSRKPSALYLLSRIESARGDMPAARQHLKQIMIETPDSAMGRSLWGGLARQAQQAQTSRATSRKPWRVSASAAGGHNNNVIALGDGLTLPSDISSKDSSFVQFALGASYDHILQADSSLSFGYSLNSNIYTDINGFDVVDQYFYARYSKRVRDGLIASLTVSDQYTLVDTDGFRNSVGVRPALLYRFNDYSIVELAYRYASSNYYANVTLAALDRDADTHTVSLVGYFRVPNTEITFQTGYFHVANDTDGANYDSDSDSFQFVASSPLLWQTEGYVSYTKVLNDYDNPDIFSPIGDIRDDDVDAVTVRFSRPLYKGLSAYARFDHTNNDSNIVLFNYDQTIWSGGLVVEF